MRRTTAPPSDASDDITITEDEEDDESDAGSPPPRRSGRLDELEVQQDYAELEVQQMIQFFQSIDNTNFDEDKKEALAIILDRVMNDSPESRNVPLETVDLFNLSAKSKIVIKEMNQLLLTIVPTGERIVRLGPAYLKSWYSSDNLRRHFMYRTKESLVTLAANRFGKRITGTSVKSIVDKLMEIVVSTSTPATRSQEQNDDGGAPQQAAQQQQSQHHQQQPPQAPRPHTTTIIDDVTMAVMKKSFMKHLKGEAREHCQLGHKLELPIGKDFMNDVNFKNKLGSKTRIISLHKVGLVAKKLSPWAKDSIDFIAFVCNKDEVLELWGIEIKSRQTHSTITQEKQKMRKLRRRKYEEINAAQVYEFVDKRSERFQLLHHAYVYNFDRVALVVGDNAGKVLNATVIDYSSDTILSSYGKVIDKLKEEVLDWAYDISMDSSDIIIPDRIVKLCTDMSQVNCREALYSSVKLWKCMFDDTSVLPRPTLKRIIPRSHAKWNSGKHGSDSVTKVCDECPFCPPKWYTNFESKACGRCFTNLSAAVLRLCQIITAKKDIEKSYPTLTHYRDAASHRFTHKKILRLEYLYFKQEMNKIENPESVLRNHEENSRLGRPSRPQRVRFDNRAVEDKLDYAFARTFDTPARSKKRIIDKGNATSMVQVRKDNCTGFPFEVVDQGLNTKDPRRTCYICRAKTKWMCIKCRFYFCLDYRKTSNRQEHLCYTKEKESSTGNKEITKIFGKTCFHIGHEDALRQTMLCQGVSSKENNQPK